eukprot:SAG22_NODE_21056_length_260_cov_0.925466_1_plen_86_part_11
MFEFELLDNDESVGTFSATLNELYHHSVPEEEEGGGGGGGSDGVGGGFSDMLARADGVDPLALARGMHAGIDVRNREKQLAVYTDG